LALMNQFIHGVVQAIAETFPFPDPILEIGSYQVPGQERLAELRSLFPGRAYLGIDRRAGPGVDCIADVEDLPQPDASVGAVLALNTFEHVPHFWRGFEEIYRVLRPDGMLLLSVPFYFHEHSYPSDYWRFTPEALELLLADYPSKLLGWHGPPRRPLGVWALACREARPAISPEQFDRYRALLGRYAREPLRWGQRLRYRIGSWLCGLRPFAPYLQRECWETVCRNRVSPRAEARRPRGRRAGPRTSRTGRAEHDGPVLRASSTHAASTPQEAPPLQ
jgi:SAM-dependent methyltransferase